VPAAPDGPSSSVPPASGLLTGEQATRKVLRAAIIPTLVVGVLAVIVAAVLRGGAGAVAAVLALVIVLAFFASGQYVLGRILSRNPELALSGGLLLYLTQVLVLFGLIALLRDATWLDSRVFAGVVVVLTLVWTTAAVLATLRTRVLYVEPEASEETS
jgi:ATP synthase protein I